MWILKNKKYVTCSGSYKRLIIFLQEQLWSLQDLSKIDVLSVGEKYEENCESNLQKLSQLRVNLG